MSPTRGDVELLCVDCRTTHTQPPQRAAGSRSPRCHEHQQQRTRHLAAGRQARQRARNSGTTAPTAAEWQAAYQPQRLTRHTITAVLLDEDDLDQLAGVISDLRDAMDSGNNAYRREDTAATRHALRNLLDRAYETYAVLEELIPREAQRD